MKNQHLPKFLCSHFALSGAGVEQALLSACALSGTNSTHVWLWYQDPKDMRHLKTYEISIKVGIRAVEC